MRTTRATAAGGENTIIPYRWGRLAVGTALGGLAVGVLDGVIAGMAQRSDGLWYASVGTPWYPYSLTRHVLATAALALLTVAVATSLTRRGAGLLGGLMILGVVAGPMAVCAAPVSRSLLDDSLVPYWWWSLLVGAVHVTVLTAWTWWTTAALRHLDLSPNPTITVAPADGARPGAPVASAASGAVFLTVAAAALVAQAVVERGQVQADLGVVAMLGWAVLAGGLAATVAESTRRWTGPTSRRSRPPSASRC